MKTLRFVTKNEHKAKEVQEILSIPELEVRAVPMEINEIQTSDVDLLVRDKVLKAFREIGHPLIVEHTGLYIHELNEFPGGLTQVFWDSLKADKFAELIGGLKNPSLTAQTTIGFCDGRRIYTFSGKIEGRVPAEPAGDRHFQWDPVFVPDGYDKTFAQLGKVKNEISMRRKAFDKFRTYLEAQ